MAWCTGQPGCAEHRGKLKAVVDYRPHGREIIESVGLVEPVEVEHRCPVLDREHYGDYHKDQKNRIRLCELRPQPAEHRRLCTLSCRLCLLRTLVFLMLMVPVLRVMLVRRWGDACGAIILIVIIVIASQKIDRLLKACSYAIILKDKV